MFLVIFGMLKKLFSKSIVEDDWLVIRKDLSDFSFEQEVWGARLAVVLSVLFLLCAHFGVPSMRFGYMYLFLMFGVSLLFIRSAFLAPTQSHAALLICFFLSWMMCAAAGGIDEARVSQALVPVRDDRIARIEIQDGHYNVMAKPQNWAPFSWVRRFLP
jgi:hypothetical protein